MTAALDAALALVLAVLAYAWLLYPVLVRRAAVGRPAPRGEAPPGPLPRVAVLVSAFNEEQEIGDRIGNLLLQDVPADRLRVLVGMDGCTDGRGTGTDPWTAGRGSASAPGGGFAARVGRRGAAPLPGPGKLDRAVERSRDRPLDGRTRKRVRSGAMDARRVWGGGERPRFRGRG